VSKIDKRHRKWDPVFDNLFFSAWFNHGNNVDVLSVILKNRFEKLGILSDLGVPIEELKEQISEMEKQKLFFNFKEKIKNNIKDNKFSVITEMKRMSPSAGYIIPYDKYNPVEIAKIYEKNKATCLSVLTEPNFFGGDFQDMMNIKEAGIRLPILCKDFMVTKWQLYFARSRGADAILLILAAFDLFKKENKKLLYEFYEEALKLNMSVIIETHTVEEAERALEFKEALIGVNNRNLKTLKTDKNTTYSINNVLKNFNGPLISESGIKTKEELLDINFKTQIKTFLIGESLLKNLDNNSIFSVL
jgi:indole-3-glycerol phosphate synthase